MTIRELCGFEVGLDRPFFLIAGPCVIESAQLQLDVAGQLKEITAALGIPFIFKSSYDKANRSSGGSFRGPGMDEGLEILAERQAPARRAGAHRRACRGRDRRRGGRSSTCCRRRPSCAARPTSSAPSRRAAGR